MNSLAGKTAVVTGAARGSGRAAALALAQAGAQVIVQYGHGASDAEALVGEIRGIGCRSNAIAADLSAPDGPHRFARRVRAIVGDRLDILVANAGFAAEDEGERFPADDFELRYALNVRAPYFLVQQLLPILCKGSSITFLMLAAAHAAPRALSGDAASAGAVHALARHFAYVLGARGIRVNAIAQNASAGEAAEIGGTLAFLASDAARWVTGGTVHVDGRPGLRHHFDRDRA